MNRKQVFYAFLRDIALETLLFFAFGGVLILFYQLWYRQAEVLYPTALSLFFLGLWLIIRWNRFHAFYKDLEPALENPGYKIHATTEEQKKTADVIEALHTRYLNELATNKMNYREHRRLISQFVHSLKTPVTVMDLALQTEQRQDQDADNRESGVLSQDLTEENNRLRDMLDNLLNLLRLDEFSSDFAIKPINLADSLKRIINARKRSFIYGHVLPKLEILTDRPTVLTDEKWNEMLLDQLLSNAIKYSCATHEKSRTVFFTLSQHHDRLLLSIRDEGIGIPESDLSRIRNPFFTGENGRKVRNATGIGLYIASRIAENLGLTLTIHSREGEGTEVTLSYLTKV